MAEPERRHGHGEEDEFAWGGQPAQHVHMPEHQLKREGLRAAVEGYGEGPLCPTCGRPWPAGVEAAAGPHRGKGPALPDDHQLKAALEVVLTGDPWLDASQISVQVRDGVVTLGGAVADEEAKRRGEFLAQRLFGVRDVRNELRALPATPPSA